METHESTGMFDDAEFGLICAVLNGAWLSPVDPLLGPDLTDRKFLRHEVVAEVSEAIEIERLDTVWQVDAAELMTKLRHLTPRETRDLLAAVEAFWATAPRRAPSGISLADALFGRYEPGPSGAIVRAAVLIAPIHVLIDRGSN